MHYYKPELKGRALQYFNRVKDELRYCQYDQPYDGGDVVWLWGKKMDLRDLFELYDIPEKYWETIAPYMVCQGCGHDDFDLYSDVCTNDDIDAEIHNKLSEGEKKYKRKINSLIAHAEKFPYLILKHPLAKRIFDEINSKTLPEWKSKKFECYRARPVRTGHVYSIDDMDAPSEGISNMGRYNHAGKIAFYVSTSEDCAILEVLEDHTVPSLVWVQKYEIASAKGILDLTVNWDDFYSIESRLFLTLLNFRVFEQKGAAKASTWKPEYLLTNFIADCAKYAGYAGIKYSSVKGYDPNLVFFDRTKIAITPISGPQTVTFNPENPTPSIVDF